MTKAEYHLLEGWINHETYHAALLAYNSEKILKEMDQRLGKSPVHGLMSPTCITDKIKDSMPDHMQSNVSLDKVDSWAIQHNRYLELVADGRLTAATPKELESRFAHEGSTTCRRRLRLLKEIGADTQDHFFDHDRFNYDRIDVGAPWGIGAIVECCSASYTTIKKGQQCKIKEILDADRFKGPKTMEGGHYLFKHFKVIAEATPEKLQVGDKVVLIDNFMSISAEEGVSLSYAKSDAIPGQVYTIKSCDNSIVLEESRLGLYLNPRQFRLATEQDKIESEHAFVTEALGLTDNKCAEQAPQPVQEDVMYPDTQATVAAPTLELKIETISYVNGKPIKNFSVEEQATLIIEVEARIAALKSIKSKSKAINAEIAKFNAFLKDAVAMFDSLIAD